MYRLTTMHSVTDRRHYDASKPITLRRLTGSIKKGKKINEQRSEK